MTDYERGLEALKIYHKESQRLYPNEYTISWDDFIAYINKKSKSFIAGLGLGILMAETTDSQIEDAMETVAKKTMGKLPESPEIFRQAVINRMQEFDWNAVKTISSDSATDLLNMAQSAGEEITEGVRGLGVVLKNSKYIIPVLLVVGVGAYFAFYGGAKGYKK